MIFSSPFSQPTLLISIPNQPNKSSFPFPLLTLFSTTPSSPTPKMTSSTFPSSALPPNFTASSPTSKSSSFYEVLGIPMGASLEEIKTAYRKLARVCHPDVAPKDSPADEFLRIQAAYSTLSDPEKRLIMITEF